MDKQKKGVSILAVTLVVAFSLHLIPGTEAACSGSTCAECIISDPSCSWCSQKDFASERCKLSTTLRSDGCVDDFIESPSSSVVKTEDVSVRDSVNNENAIQVAPQKVKITTRPGKKETLSLTFRAANNYPVDLYFLFDSSLSMKGQIEGLANLAVDIGKSIQDISSNYLMGYGTFQDKVVLPFTDTTPIKLTNPCTGYTESCNPPFDMKHELSLTDDVDKFQEVVKDSPLTGNLDRPEGSVDAIMQAVACKDEIGWRDHSRKMLIFGSNDRFHIAGDGRLAGIILPNDGECHLNGEGKYTKGLEQDYPSVSQLTDIIQRKEVHVIFAVTDEQMELFEELSKRIPWSTVEKLDAGSQSIKDIIEKKYKEMISEVEMLHTPLDGVDVKIKAKSDSCEIKDTNVCKGIQIGQEVKFDVEVTVTSCPASDVTSQTVEIYPESLRQDALVLEIETVCECGCTEDEDTWEKDSDVCTDGNGTLVCGLCQCHAGRFGTFCECDDSGSTSVQSGCIQPGDSGINCNGAGHCVCGTCQCEEGFSGMYCECNDRSCGSYQGELCGGIRGQCSCGTCACKAEYTGETCECPISTDTCKGPEGKVCSDNGNCECGACLCNEGYVGPYCENCVICGVCDNPDYRDCAGCLQNYQEVSGASDNSDLSAAWQYCHDECDGLLLGTAPEELNKDGPGYCSVKQADGCFLEFTVDTEGTNVTIYVISKTCPTPVDIVPIVVGVTVGVILLGIAALLLWKLITYFVDKREYSRFEKELSKGNWAKNDNPFYKGATTTYRNPMMDASDPSLDKKP